MALAGSGVALLFGFGLVPAATGAVKADFGDAPDGAPAGYASAPGAIGHFPSKAATPGPRHSPFGSFFLGAGVSGEAGSRQVNKDTLDDGASASLAKCGSSTLSVVLNGTALPPATLTSAHVAYVNAWFDWNRDGDWADSTDGCSPEWAIQNLPVSMDKLSPAGVAVLPIGFTAGKRTRDVWERVTLTLDQPVSNADGSGSASPYTEGETEDYLIPAGKTKPIISTRKKKKEKERERKEKERRKREREEGKNEPPPGKKRFRVSCAPDPAVIPHGGVATVKFVIADSGKGWIFGSPSTQKGPGGKATVTPVKPQPMGVPPGYVAADGFKQSGSKVDPPPRVQTVVVKFTFTRGNQTQNLSCKVLIIHWAAGNPNPFLPRVVCEGTCRGGTSPQKPPTLHGGGELKSPLPPQSFFDVFFDLEVNAFKIVLPGNEVTQIPPGSPYSCAPETTTTTHDTLLCTGSLPAHVEAKGQLETREPISPNTAQLYGRQPGSTTFEGPFTLSGP